MHPLYVHVNWRWCSCTLGHGFSVCYRLYPDDHLHYPRCDLFPRRGRHFTPRTVDLIPHRLTPCGTVTRCYPTHPTPDSHLYGCYPLLSRTCLPVTVNYSGYPRSIADGTPICYVPHTRLPATITPAYRCHVTDACYVRSYVCVYCVAVYLTTRLPLPAATRLFYHITARLFVDVLPRPHTPLPNVWITLLCITRFTTHLDTFTVCSQVAFTFPIPSTCINHVFCSGSLGLINLPWSDYICWTFHPSLPTDIAFPTCATPWIVLLDLGQLLPLGWFGWITPSMPTPFPHSHPPPLPSMPPLGQPSHANPCALPFWFTRLHCTTFTAAHGFISHTYTRFTLLCYGDALLLRIYLPLTHILHICVALPAVVPFTCGLHTLRLPVEPRLRPTHVTHTTRLVTHTRLNSYTRYVPHTQYHGCPVCWLHYDYPR